MNATRAREPFRSVARAASHAPATRYGVTRTQRPCDGTPCSSSERTAGTSPAARDSRSAACPPSACRRRPPLTTSSRPRCDMLKPCVTAPARSSTTSVMSAAFGVLMANVVAVVDRCRSRRDHRPQHVHVIGEEPLVRRRDAAAIGSPPAENAAVGQQHERRSDRCERTSSRARSPSRRPGLRGSKISHTPPSAPPLTPPAMNTRPSGSSVAVNCSGARHVQVGQRGPCGRRQPTNRSSPRSSASPAGCRR